MELTTKPDFQACLDRVEAWWDGQVLDPRAVTIYVKPDRPGRKVPPHPGSVRERWLDVEWNLARVEAGVENGVFLAENFPRYMPNLGPEICATAYGCELDFSEASSWSKPVAKSIRDVLSLRPNLDTFYWNVIRGMTDLSVERGAGKWLTCTTDLHTHVDLLAALRDPQNLALDYADDLPGVEAATRHVTPHFRVFFDDLWDRIRARGNGELACSTWGVALSRRPMYYVSCDFICMISQEMFRRTVLPALDWEIRQLGRAIFHLDGPGALRHLDDLLATKLHAIQWVYGAGATTAKDWLALYRRIQSAGKGVEVHCKDMAEAKIVMDNLRPQGVWLCVGGSHPRAEAEAFLADVARWSVGKR